MITVPRERPASLARAAIRNGPPSALPGLVDGLVQRLVEQAEVLGDAL